VPLLIWDVESPPSVAQIIEQCADQGVSPTIDAAENLAVLASSIHAIWTGGWVNGSYRDGGTLWHAGFCCGQYKVNPAGETVRVITRQGYGTDVWSAHYEDHLRSPTESDCYYRHGEGPV